MNINEILYHDIDSNIDEWVSKNLHGFTFRQYQKEYIANIIYSIIGNNKRVNIVEAPTGSGKSIMVMITTGVLDKYYDKKSYILCSDLYLWNQYSKAIDKFKLKSFGRIKGTWNNYICEETGEDFSLAPCRLANIPYRSLFNEDWCNKCHWECALTCEYVKERKRAILSHITLMTYQLYFPIMCDKIISANMKDIFPPRDVVFCDECHNVPDLCQQYSTIVLNEHSDFDKFHYMVDFCLEEEDIIQDLAIKNNSNYFNNFFDQFRKLYHKAQDCPASNKEEYLNILKDIWDFISILQDIGKDIIDIYDKVAAEARAMGKYLSKREFKALDIAKWVDKFSCSIKEYCKFADEYVECVVKTDNMIPDPNNQYNMIWPDNPQVCYKFAKEDILVYMDLLQIQQYTVMLSATIGDKASFDDNIGMKFMDDKESEMFVIPSTFNFSKSPVYFIPGNKMSKDFIEISMPNNAKIINTILKSSKHINEKGIIHTGSYKNAYELLKYLDQECKDRIFIYNSSKEKKEILEKFTNSNNGVLIGPTLTEGIDFPDDGCRFIIILKIPYPYLGDNLVKAKCLLFPRWYNSQTSNNVIQGIGRGNRHINDWSTTYILDGSFEKLYVETRGQYPKELVERMHILTNHKMKYRLPNPDNNPWINKCNEIIAQNECNVQLKESDPNYVKYSLHHILPRFEYPDLIDDKNNWLFLPVMDHVNLHYCMWKGNPKYANAFWFCYGYFHKYANYTIPDEDYEQLKKDLAKYKNQKGA